MVVGKFSPFHSGHDFLIRYGKSRVDRLFILSWSDPEYPGCAAENRLGWLRELHPDCFIAVVRGGPKPFTGFHWPLSWGPFGGDGIYPILPEPPSADEPEGTSREYTAEIFWRLLKRPCDAVFTSEAYGGPWADHLSQCWKGRGFPDADTRHEMVDLDRHRFPVSGTGARLSPLAHRPWMPPVVFRDQVLRIAFLGGESTGKTTLARTMAETHGTCWAPEYGRELWENQGGKLIYEDMVRIARTQVHREDALMETSNRFLFCDSTPLTTSFYSEAMFGRVDPALLEWAKRPYDLLFLCGDEFPFVQDGTRQDADFREKQQAWYRGKFRESRVEFHELSGSLSARAERVRKILGETVGP